MTSRLGQSLDIHTNKTRSLPRSRSRCGAPRMAMLNWRSLHRSNIISGTVKVGLHTMQPEDDEHVLK